MVFTRYLAVLALAMVTAVLAVRTGIFRHNKKKTSTLPPGPSSLEFIYGLAFGKYPWWTFTHWAKQYGSIYSCNVFGLWRIVVLNDFDAYASVLASTQVASRPQYTVAGELMDFNRTTVMLAQGPVLRMHRRLAHLVLNPAAVQHFVSVQEDAIRCCIVAMCKEPDTFKELRFTIIRSIIEMTYGIKLQSSDDPFIEQADIVFGELGQALVPGRYLVDVIPILKHVPDWFIGGELKRYARQVRKKLDAMFDHPFKVAEQSIADGHSPDSFVAAALKRVLDGEIPECTEKVVSDVAGTLYGAGVDTTFCVLLTVILGACLHPAKQARAQEEIDTVVGRHRLPRLADLDSLPYVRALIMEAMRMYPVGPLSAPRAAEDDSFFHGFLIPKGSIVIPNVWAIARLPDGSGLPSEDFHPERFLSTSPPQDPMTYSFGAGRRSCIGKTVAENFLFGIIPALLAIYNIRPPESLSGQENPLHVEWKSSIMFCPVFNCRFVVRNEALLNCLSQDLDA